MSAMLYLEHVWIDNIQPILDLKRKFHIIVGKGSHTKSVVVDGLHKVNQGVILYLNKTNRHYDSDQIVGLIIVY